MAREKSLTSEPCLNLRRHLDPVQALVMAIHDRSAAGADSGGDAGPCPRQNALLPAVADPGDDTQPYKRFQDPVDGCPGNTPDPPLDNIIDMVGRRMIATGGQRSRMIRLCTVRASPCSRQKLSSGRHFFIHKSLPVHVWY